MAYVGYRRPRALGSLAIICGAFVISAALAGVLAAQEKAAVPRPGEVVLVADGAAKAVIVADEALSPSEKFAVEELQRYLEEMSDTKLAVIAPAQVTATEGRALIVVGRKTAALLCPELKFDGLGPDGFIIQTVGNKLVLAGGEQRGSMYAVYVFLESLGLRWWTPSETFVPKLPTIRVAAQERREVPALECRDFLYGEMWNDAGRLWAARNRINGMAGDPAPAKWGGYYYVAGVHGHNTIDLVEDAVGKGNLKPEMWSLAKGRDGKLSRVQTEVCQTNPEVFAATVRSLVKLYKEHPDTQYLVVAHEDNNNYCQCTDCAAISQREGTSTGQFLDFVNRCAEAVEKEVPGARIMMDVYAWSRRPPLTLRPRANLLARFAPIEADLGHPLAAGSNEENKQIRDDLQAWGKIASKLFIWGYVGNRAHYLMPNPDFDAMVSNVKLYADNRAVGIMEQGTHAGVATEFAPLRMWVLARALWNPQADGQALITEFLKGYYGPAAPAIQNYIDIMHRYGREHDFHLGRFTRMSAPFLQPAILAEAEATMRQADQAVAGDATLERRVRHAHLPLWYMLAKRGPESPTWQAVEAKVGKLDFTVLAEQSNRVAKDYRISAVADPELAGPWFEWLTDYAALLKKGGPVLPPELKAEDLKNCRLVQARQIDSSYLERAGQWIKMADASDGWVLRVIKPSWMVQHTFSRYDEYQVGKTYKLFVRVKGSEKKKDGVGFMFGLTAGRGGRLPSKDVPAADLADGKFHVVELGPFTAGEEVGLWMATSRDGSMSEVYFDCLWLQRLD